MSWYFILPLGTAVLGSVEPEVKVSALLFQLRGTEQVSGAFPKAGELEAMLCAQHHLGGCSRVQGAKELKEGVRLHKHKPSQC